MRPASRPPAETAGAVRRRSRRSPLRAVAWCAALTCVVASTGQLRSLDLPRLARLLATGADEARTAARAGDAAPGQARFSGRFACRITALPDGGMLFVDSGGSGLFRKTGDAIALLAYAGLEAPGGGRFASFCESAAGGDGTIAFHAALADGRDGIYRIAPGSSGPQPVLREGDPVALARGTPTIVSLLGPAVDGSGAVVIAADLGDGTSIILASPPQGAPRVVIQTGDPLGAGAFLRSPVAPAVNSGGTVAFTATLDSGLDLVAARTPGESPVPLFEARPSPPFPAPFLELAPPAIDDQGRVAFLLADRGTVRLERASPGLTIILAAPGFPAPGVGAFDEITDLPPAIDASGSVLFGAIRSDGRSGIYVARPQLAVIAEDSLALPDGESLGGVGNRQPAPTPAFAAGGAVWFTAEAAGRPGLFSSDAGGIGAEVRAGDPIPGPARLVAFLDGSIPYLGGGPSLADDGSILFDARLAGGSRGLFARDRSGRLAAAALDGEPAPGSGSGRFDGERFAFHSTNGVVAAFLGVERPESGAAAGAAAGPALYYGPLGGGAWRRVIGAGDPEPGGSRTVVDLLPPSRLNRSGDLAVPAILSDGGTVLYGYDGSSIVRLIGAGDAAPGGARYVSLFTGSRFLGAPIPPIVDDGGVVLFGASTSDADTALYTVPLAPGGGGNAPRRVLGNGDEVPGGTLSPFEVQSLDRDAGGRIAFEAIFDDGFEFATFLAEGGSTRLLARPFESLDDLGIVLQVTPELALLDAERVACGLRFFDGREGIIVSAPGATAQAGGSDGPRIVAVTGGAAPDGGLYTSFRRGLRATSRLASDGAGSLAFAAATDAGPEEIVIIGPPPNSPPVADAGPDRVVECAGPGGTEVALDGRASHDPDGDPLTYLWTGPFGEARGVQAVVSLPLGVSTITLVVGDGRALSAPAVVAIEVRDTIPPAIDATASPAFLWPPDGRMVEVVFRVVASDRCDPGPAVALLDVTTLDAAGGRPGPGVLGADLGTDDRSIALRADRSGSGAGRVYRITYRAADRSGNTSATSALVVVPHDARR